MLIFLDFDGTLVHVADRFYAVYEHVCRRLKLRTLPREDYWLARQQALGTRAILEQTDSGHAYEKFIAQRTRLIEARAFLRLDTLREGAVSCLKELSERHELHLVSLRNSRRNLLWQLRALGIRGHFAGVHSASAFGNHEDKVRLLEAAGATSGRDLIIGDTENDIRAGRRLRLRTCAIMGGMRTAEAVRDFQADDVIASLTELPPLLHDLPVLGEPRISHAR